MARLQRDLARGRRTRAGRQAERLLDLLMDGLRGGATPLRERTR
jgi:hypothetical protein